MEDPENVANQNVRLEPPQLPLNRPKKVKADPGKWQRSIKKLNKAKGSNHFSHIETFVFIYLQTCFIIGLPYLIARGMVVPQRQMALPDCVCDCRERVTGLQCAEIFQTFANLESHDAQNVYLRGQVKAHGTENLTNGNSRKNFRYKLSININEVYVCKRFFMGVHGIKSSRL